METKQDRFDNNRNSIEVTNGVLRLDQFPVDAKVKDGILILGADKTIEKVDDNSSFLHTNPIQPSCRQGNDAEEILILNDKDSRV